jgi:hypothetical protein
MAKQDLKAYASRNLISNTTIDIGKKILSLNEGLKITYCSAISINAEAKKKNNYQNPNLSLLKTLLLF